MNSIVDFWINLHPWKTPLWRKPQLQGPNSGLVMLPRLECGGMVSAHCNFCLSDSSHPPTSAFQEAATTGACRHAWLIFCCYCILCRDRIGLGFTSQTSLHPKTHIPDPHTPGPAAEALTGQPCTETSKKSTGSRTGRFFFKTVKGLELLASSEFPASASRVAGTTSRLECSGVIIAHCNLNLPGSSDPPTPAYSLPASWDHWCRVTFLIFCRDRGLIMLPRLVSSSWIQVILSPGLPKCWDYRHVPLRLPTLLKMLGMQRREESKHKTFLISRS
ncbi:Protein PPP5D1 [Plecturocebus cupreus]